jgi:hypothetical protein
MKELGIWVVTIIIIGIIVNYLCDPNAQDKVGNAVLGCILMALVGLAVVGRILWALVAAWL